MEGLDQALGMGSAGEGQRGEGEHDGQQDAHDAAVAQRRHAPAVWGVTVGGLHPVPVTVKQVVPKHWGPTSQRLV